MHGTNPIRKQYLDDGQALHLEDCFYTLQGEGPFAGIPSVFCRLSGCWLSCTWCDTQFEAGMARTAVSILDIARQIEALGNRADLVVLTGGDPMRQNIVPLIRLLTERYYHVQIETAGVMWVPQLEEFITKEEYPVPRPGFASIVCSPKTGHVNEKVAKHAAAWKYIIRATDRIGNDGLPCTSTQNAALFQPLARPTANWHSPVYLQPCDEDDPAKNAANVQLCTTLALRHGYRVSLQQHKLLQLP